jgi:PAS domain S-box-containing protein
MSNFISHFFKIPEYSDHESRAVARMAYGTAVGMFFLSLIFVIAVFIAAPDLLLRASILAFVFTSTSLGVITLIRSRRLQFASALLVGVMWLAVTISSITAGGITAPVFSGYLVVVFASSLISNRWFRLIIWLSSIASAIGIAIAENYQVLPPLYPYTLTARLSVYLFFLVTTILLQNVNRQNMQSLLKQTSDSETRYRNLLENIPSITYINSVDESARTEYVSPQVEDLLGYARENYTDDPEFWKKILHPEDRERVLAVIQVGTKTQLIFNMEYRLIAKDHHVVWVKDEANLVKDQRGQPLYWLGVWTDITAAKQAEEEQADLIGEMTKRTIQLQTAAQVARAASSILDLHQLLSNAVELIRSHFDYYYVGLFLVDELKEWAVLSAATGDQGQQMLTTGYRLKLEDSSMIGWCVRNQQARIALDVGADAVRFKNPRLPLTRSEIALPLITHGEVIGAMTIQSAVPAAFTSVDLTTLQTMSDQLANAIENARLFTERTDLIAELEARNAELERFTYTASHDLRSPLVTIRGFLGYLRQDALHGELDRFEKDITRIANAVDKMQHLLNDLLELSRIGRVMNKSELIPFHEIVLDVLELLDGILVQNNVRVIAQPDLPEVFGDRARLVEAVQNLVSNAAKFMGDQPRPTIEIGVNGIDENANPILFVRDNGIGVDPQYHERIFGLFNRLDSTTEGTGIGLTLVKRIIEIHGGRIWVESQPDMGATFYFTLPLPPK